MHDPSATSPASLTSVFVDGLGVELPPEARTCLDDHVDRQVVIDAFAGSLLPAGATTDAPADGAGASLDDTLQTAYLDATVACPAVVTATFLAEAPGTVTPEAGALCVSLGRGQPRPGADGLRRRHRRGRGARHRDRIDVPRGRGRLTPDLPIVDMTSEPSDQGPPPPPPPQPPAGWRIGRYRVESVLGTGAFATVYRAVDERLDDTVAVKVLAENHSLDPEIRKRFLTEGRVLRRIDSPYVVGVHDLGETDRQQPFLVLEYAARGTLAQRVADLRARGSRPGPADLRAVAEPLARALDAVHRAGLVHRDVNPGNVLLTTRGLAHRAPAPPATVVGADERPVLADLGLCKDLALHSGHTSAGGTEGFRPPELRGGPAIIDHRADLWSLSALLVWLATGTPPGGGPVAPALAPAGLPAALVAALARSLADDPGHRHPDALAWLADVEAALAPPPTGPVAGAVAVAIASTGPWPMPEPGPYAGPGTCAAPPRAPVPHLPDGSSWRVRHSTWVLAALPLGLTTWIGFLYVGARTGRTRWLWTAGAYGAAALAIVVLAVLTPLDENGDTDPESWQMNVGIATMLVVWIGGLVHALLANRDWLRWRAGSA